MICIDSAILDRVRQRIGPLEDALAEVAANPSPHTLEALRQAIDGLMRALAAVLIETAENEGP
ncbi:MAG: hypothetical protein JO255_07520 [Alphaproteobacteria bacterium]|nr:hypothetical protein [Alphaproteobacteria bacterium]